MRDHELEIQEAGATLAAIGLGDANYARLFREETGITFPLLIDKERRAYKVADLRKANLLHLFRGHNFAARKEAKATGHRQHKLGKDPFQLGASFVFAPGNRDVFAHVSETFGDNASVVKVLVALADLRRTGAKRSGADSSAREWDAAHPREP